MSNQKIDFKNIKAAVFDLDGVITQTAKVHAKAWKRLFDDYLQYRNEKYKEDNPPFDIEIEYSKYVDGIPRYDGVKTFLSSRNIELEHGDPSDDPDKETICGLGNRKNKYFLKKLKTEGVDYYEDSINFIKFLKSGNIKTAVISSSRNCTAVLQATGIKDLFDTQVDGTDLSEHNLKGKPAPDIFIEACRRLNIPTKKAIALEDAIQGVTAAAKADFAHVIGVDRVGKAQQLKDNGADIAVTDVTTLYKSLKGQNNTPSDEIPSALQKFNDITASFQDKTPAVFLDYDGTLTPIVERPEDAVISEEMKKVVTQLAELCTVGIISGRDLKDVISKTGIENIVYAGSHGFDVKGLKGSGFSFQKGKEFLPALNNAEKKLKQLLSPIPNCQVERKEFSIAIHYRRVRQDHLGQIENTVDKVNTEFDSLKKNKGKKIFELQPDIDWDKGKALLWLMDKLELKEASTIPFYIGDDVTDEDAFKVLKARGISILVTDKDQNTNAKYKLKNPNQVRHFLEKLVNFLGG